MTVSSDGHDARRPFEELVILVAGGTADELGLTVEFLASRRDEPAERIIDALAAAQLMECTAGTGTEAGRARFITWLLDHQPHAENDDLDRPYLPGDTYTIVRKQDLTCLLTTLQNIGKCGPPDPRDGR
jgi:hypothetical protein